MRPVVLKLGAFCGVTWAEIEQKLQSESLVSVLDGYVDVCLNTVEGKLRRLEEPEKKEEAKQEIKEEPEKKEEPKQEIKEEPEKKEEPKQEIKEEPEKKEEPKQEIKEEPEKQEEKKDVGAPEQLAQELPVAEAYPQSRQEALDRIRRISERFESIRNERRAGAALLKNSRPDLNSEASVEERKDAIRSKNILLDNSDRFFLRTMAELDGYLQYGDPSVFKKNDMKALRKLRENVEIEWNKVGDLCKKMDAETEALDARYEELRNPVGSKHSFEEAVEAFEAVQDRKLSWGRTGGHAQQFNAIKEAVREWRDPNSDKSEEEKKLDVYRACDAYLREHAGNGKTIGGQGSEVGRLRKQAVVNLLQVLSKEPALQESLQQYEAERPARVKLNFAKLEKSLAKASDAKVKLSKYEKGTQKKAYAELNTAKEQRIR